MKRKYRKALSQISFAIAAVLLLSGPAHAGNGPGNPQGAGLTGATTCVVDTRVTPSAAEAESLAFMHEEEKLARDVYLTLYAQWQSNVFTNIARSEQQHMDQVKCFLDAYGLPVVASDVPNQFNTPELQALYDDLTARGATRLSEALRVGALIEEVDMLDLQTAIDASEIAEVKVMYGHLMAGSENHLRAFVGNLEALGESYTAQAMETEAVRHILGETTQINASGINLNNERFVASQTRFQPRIITTTGRQGNGARFTQQEMVNINLEILPDTAHVGKHARYVSVALRQAGQGENSAFKRHGQGQWQVWNGDLANLQAGQDAPVQLQAQQETQVFAGHFQQAAGQYQVYCGYLLEDSGDLLFTSQPIEFEVVE